MFASNIVFTELLTLVLVSLLKTKQARAAQFFAAILLQGVCKTYCVALKFTTWKKKRDSLSQKKTFLSF